MEAQGQVFLCCFLNRGLLGCVGKGLRCVGSSANHTSWLGPAPILCLQWWCSFPASFLLWNILPLPGKGSNAVLLLEVLGDTCRETKWGGGEGRKPLSFAQRIILAGSLDGFASCCVSAEFLLRNFLFRLPAFALKQRSGAH